MILERVGKYLLTTEYNAEVESYRVERLMPEENEIITDPSRIEAIHRYLEDEHPGYNARMKNCYHTYLKNAKEKKPMEQTEWCEICGAEISPDGGGCPGH